MQRIFVRLHLVLVAVSLAASAWATAPIPVNCSTGGSINATIASLTQSGNTRGVTILVRGTCHENVVIIGFDHLALLASPVATIKDASNGSADVLTIFSSFDVYVQGFTITGGLDGVNCMNTEACRLVNNNIQQAAAFGVLMAGSGTLNGNHISNNSLAGVRLVRGARLLSVSNVITDNGDAGMRLLFGSNLQSGSDTIQGNAVGIVATQNSVIRMGTDTVSNNQGNGVELDSGASATFLENDVVTGNGGNGVAINDLAFAQFPADSGNNISGNQGQPDVACYPQFSATRGAGTVQGTTNCNEPANNQERRSLRQK